jgi:hypothetical protein
MTSAGSLTSRTNTVAWTDSLAGFAAIVASGFSAAVVFRGIGANATGVSAAPASRDPSVTLLEDAVELDDHSTGRPEVLPVVLDDHSTTPELVVLLPLWPAVVPLDEATCFVALSVDTSLPDVELVAAARGAAFGGLQPLNATVASVPNKLAASIIENAESSCFRIAIGSIDLVWGRGAFGWDRMNRRTFEI